MVQIHPHRRSWSRELARVDEMTRKKIATTKSKEKTTNRASPLARHNRYVACRVWSRQLLGSGTNTSQPQPQQRWGKGRDKAILEIFVGRPFCVEMCLWRRWRSCFFFVVLFYLFLASIRHVHFVCQKCTNIEPIGSARSTWFFAQTTASHAAHYCHQSQTGSSNKIECNAPWSDGRQFLIF